MRARISIKQALESASGLTNRLSLDVSLPGGSLTVPSDVSEWAATNKLDIAFLWYITEILDEDVTQETLVDWAEGIGMTKLSKIPEAKGKIIFETAYASKHWNTQQQFEQKKQQLESRKKQQTQPSIPSSSQEKGDEVQAKPEPQEEKILDINVQALLIARISNAIRAILPALTEALVMTLEEKVAAEERAKQIFREQAEAVKQGTLTVDERAKRYEELRADWPELSDRAMPGVRLVTLSCQKVAKAGAPYYEFQKVQLAAQQPGVELGKAPRNPEELMESVKGFLASVVVAQGIQVQTAKRIMEKLRKMDEKFPQRVYYRTIQNVFEAMWAKVVLKKELNQQKELNEIVTEEIEDPENWFAKEHEYIPKETKGKNQNGKGAKNSKNNNGKGKDNNRFTPYGKGNHSGKGQGKNQWNNSGKGFNTFNNDYNQYQYSNKGSFKGKGNWSYKGKNKGSNKGGFKGDHHEKSKGKGKNNQENENLNQQPERKD